MLYSKNHTAYLQLKASYRLMTTCELFATLPSSQHTNTPEECRKAVSSDAIDVEFRF